MIKKVNEVRQKEVEGNIQQNSTASNILRVVKDKVTVTANSSGKKAERTKEKKPAKKSGISVVVPAAKKDGSPVFLAMTLPSSDLKIDEENLEKSLNERISRITALARTMGHDFKLNLAPSNGGWAYSFDTNTLHYDKNDLIGKPLDYAIGIILHECGHRLYSKWLIEDKFKENEPFRMLCNAVEDPRVNNLMGSRFAGAGEFFKTIYDMDLFSEETEDMIEKLIIGELINRTGINREDAKKILEELGLKTPKYFMYGLGVIYDWYTNGGVYPKIKDKDVLGALEQTKKDFREAIVLPRDIFKKDLTEDEIMELAKKHYEICRDKLWPVYQKLIEDDKNLLAQKLAQYGQKNQQAQQSNGASGTGAPGTQGQPGGMSRDDAKKLIEGVIDELGKMAKGQQGKQSQQGASSTGASGTGAPGKGVPDTQNNGLSDKDKNAVEEAIDELGKLADDISNNQTGKQNNQSQGTKSKQAQGSSDELSPQDTKELVDKVIDTLDKLAKELSKDQKNQQSQQSQQSQQQGAGQQGDQGASQQGGASGTGASGTGASGTGSSGAGAPGTQQSGGSQQGGNQSSSGGGASGSETDPKKIIEGLIDQLKQMNQGQQGQQGASGTSAAGAQQGQSSQQSGSQGAPGTQGQSPSGKMSIDEAKKVAEEIIDELAKALSNKMESKDKNAPGSRGSSGRGQQGQQGASGSKGSKGASGQQGAQGNSDGNDSQGQGGDNSQNGGDGRSTSDIGLQDLEELLKRKYEMEKEMDSRRSVYQEKLHDVAPQVDEMSGELKNLLIINARPRYREGFDEGRKISMRRAMQSDMKMRATGKFDPTIWMKKNRPIKREYDFVFVLDESGSMSGEKEEKALQGLVMCMEALDQLKINFGVIGFSDSPQVHKKMEDKFDEICRDKVCNSIENAPSGGTNDSDAIEVGLQMVSKTDPDRVKVIIVLTDAKGKEEEVKKLVEKAEEEGIKIIGVGIGAGMEYVKGVYKNSAYVDDISSLPRTLVNLLRKEIEDAILEQKNK